LGDDQPANVVGARGDRDGQRAANATHSAVQRQLAYEQRTFRRLVVQPAISTQDAERHRQIEAGAFLANVRRSQVDGGRSGRDVVAAVLQRRADAFAALANRGVGQADRGEGVVLGLDGGDINLDLDEAGIDAIYGSADCLIEHARERTPTT